MRKMLAALLVLCATSVSPSFAQETPPRARPDPSTDEGGLWAEMDREEARARASARLNADPALNAYIRDVACRVARDACPNLRFYVMEIPLLNAQMAPNGYAEVWTGTLLRIEDEAQLAFVLGHEASHFTQDHSILAWRAMRNRANVALVLSAGVAAAGVNAAYNYPQAAQDILRATGDVIDAIQLATAVSLFGFSRENEAEADNLGFRRAIQAGYDPKDAIAIWQNELLETRASDDRDVRRREPRSSMFNTHPLTEERIATLSQLADGLPPGESFRERYRAAIRPFLDVWLRAELRRRDFGETLVLLDRLGAHGEDLGIVEYYRGEVCRLRRGENDRAQALAHYTSAIAYADAPAGTWKQLGEFARVDGHAAEAAQFYRSYLERAPDAPDRLLIESQISQLSQGVVQ